MRWRDSGEVELPRSASSSASRGTPSTHAVRIAAGRFSTTSRQAPRAAAISAAPRAMPNPEVKSPATRPRYSKLQGPAELVAAAADADVEPACEDEVAVPERRAEDAHHADCADRLTRARAREDIQTLRREDERPVGMRRDRRQGRGAPEPPPLPPATLEGGQEREVRQRARQQEERVHASVDPMKKEHPARRDECRRDERCRRLESRVQSAAIAGTLATAKSAEKNRSASSPPPKCTTSHATRKWSGAPPRSPCTVRKRSGSDSRPTKSARVSSSWGGHAVRRAMKKPATASAHAATPRANQRSARPIRIGSELVVASVVNPAES